MAGLRFKRSRVGRRRPVFRRRRPVRRMGAVKRSLMNINNYHFKRSGSSLRIRHVSGDNGDVWRIEDSPGVLTSTYASGAAWGVESIIGSYQNSFALNSRLSAVEGYTDFTNLYDRYKITGIKATFIYQSDSSAVNSSSVLPTMMYAVDKDDLTPDSFSQIRQKQDMKRKILTANRPFSVFWRPKKQMTVSSLATEVDAVATNTGWNNCGFPGINHLGLKFYLNNLYGGTAGVASTVQTQLDIQITYYLAFKDPQ